MGSHKQRQKEDCLYWYFKTMRDLGEDARYTKKADLYQIAGYKVYFEGKYAGEVITKLLKCPEVVKRVSMRVDGEIISS